MFYSFKDKKDLNTLIGVKTENENVATIRLLYNISTNTNITAHSLFKFIAKLFTKFLKQVLKTVYIHAITLDSSKNV